MSDKKLYKGSDKQISGVCSGLAEYFDIDVSLMRLIVVIATLASVGTGIIAYFIAAIVIPERDIY